MKHFGKSTALSLALIALANTVVAENILPNGSFETGTVIPGPNDYGVNGEDGCTTEGWKGGILTTGGNAVFCPPDMADGTYGLALHYAYPTASNEFTLTKDGTYSITFLTTSRAGSGVQPCKQRVDLYIDDGASPILSALPESSTRWNSHTTYVSLPAGRHTISFRGTLIEGVGVGDSSTVIDNVRITAAAENPLPNGSFENGTVILGPNNYGVNGEGGCTTEGWKGGILTTGGGTEFCPPDMADGTYGLALHDAYPAVSNEFTITKGGAYAITFLTTSRSRSVDHCKQRVDLYVDGCADPILSALPKTVSGWNSNTAYVPLSAGRHTISFRGTLVDGARDSSTIIDNIHLEPIPFLVTATGLPAEFLPATQIVETDCEKLKEGRDLDAPRHTAADGIWIAARATVTADGVSRIFTGEHFHLGPIVAESTSVVWKYSFFPFLLPNGDFEDGTSVPSQGWGVNGTDATTADWIGGILTKASTTWTTLAMPSGNYGLVLHRDYNVASNFFTVSSGGNCGLSFYYVSRKKQGVQYDCKLQVSVYIDDSVKPVATVLPTSTQKWDFYQGKFKVPAGQHLFRFVGTAIDGVDSSTIIDAVRLHELPRTGFMVLFK